MLRTHALALPLLIVLTLTGCGSPPVALEPEPTAEPPFASDEEALAAAIEVYEGFQKAYSDLARRPGDDPTRLSDWSTGSYLEASLAGLDTMKRNEWTRVGAARTSDYVLLEYFPSATEAVVVIQLCDDISAIDIVDSRNESVLPEGRNLIGTMVATFDCVGARLLLANRELVEEGC